MPRQLETRITAAFADGAKSEDFPLLIADTAAKAASDKAAAARTRALEPTCPSVEVATARKEMEDAAFVSDRMNVAAARLRDRFRQVGAAEENSRRKIEYDRVISLRDELAKELAQVYPALVTQLTDLMQRIAANDLEITSVNNHLPDDGSRVLETELVARNLQGFMNDGVETTSIIRELRIPAWDFEVHQPFAWPIDDRLQQHAVIPISIRA
jgi:hypothetical protein